MPTSPEPRSAPAAHQGPREGSGALARLEAAAAEAGTSPDAQFLLARALEEEGELERARSAYLAALALDPDHFGALNDFGALLWRTDFRAAALTLYRRAVHAHPGELAARINLANALHAGGEAAAAEEHLLIALSAAPENPDVHQALAAVLEDLGEGRRAEQHRLESCRSLRVFPLPYRGAGPALRILVLNSARGGNIPTRFLLPPGEFAATVLLVESWRRGLDLPPHDLILNAVGDADLCAAALEHAEVLTRESASPCVNPPARVRATGRMQMARLAAGVPGIRTPRMARVPRGEAAAAAGAFGYPLLARSPGFHTGRHFVRAESAGALGPALEGLPGKELLLIEPLEARGTDGRWRKYRVLFIGGEMLPLHLAAGSGWKVHYFTGDMESDPGLRAEEARFLNDPEAVLGAPAAGALRALSDRVGLDYFGVDFALSRAGEVLLFEANATMVVNPAPDGAIWDYRRPALDRAIRGAQSLWRERARVPRPVTDQ